MILPKYRPFLLRLAFGAVVPFFTHKLKQTMKRHFTLLLAGIMACLSLTSSLAQTCTGNLLTNPGFENGLTGWSTAGDVTISTSAHSGTKAAKVGGTGYGSVGYILPTTPGTAYTAKVWAKKTGTAYTIAELRFLNSSWAALPGGVGQPIASTGYTELTMSGTAPTGTAYVYVIASKDGGGSIEVDDFCLTTGGSGSQLPDLVPVVTPGVTSASNNQALTFTISSKNIGTVTGASGYFQGYLSDDDVWSPNTDLYLNVGMYGTFQPEQLAPGETSQPLSRSYTIPASNTFNGQKYLLVVIDYLSGIQESNENNNVFAIPVQISTPPTPGNCINTIGQGEILCTEKSGSNLDVYLKNGQTVTKYSLNGQGTVTASQNMGLLVKDSVLVQGNQVVNKLANGSITFTKTIQQSVLDSLPVVLAAAQLTNGNFVLAGYRKTTSPVLSPSINKLVMVLADANLNALEVKSKSVSYISNPYYTSGDFVLGIYPVPNGAFDIFYTSTAETLVTFRTLRLSRYAFGNPQSFDEAPLIVANLINDTPIVLTQTPCGSYRFSGPTGFIGQKGSFKGRTVIYYDMQDLSLISVQSAGSGSLDYYGGYDSWSFRSTLPDSLTGTFQYRPGFDTIPGMQFLVLNPGQPPVGLQVPYFNYDYAVAMQPNDVFLFGKNNGQVFVEVPTDCNPVITYQPDLTGENLNFSNSTSYLPGDGVSYSVTVKNIGNYAINSTISMSFYLSTDNVLSADDAITGEHITSGIAAGGQSLLSVYLSVPPTMPGGTYYVIVKIDPNNDLLESNESNNVVVSAQTITVAGGGGTCSIVTTLVDNQCFDNSTPNDPSDDIFGFTVNVASSGSGCSTQFTDGSGFNYTYGGDFGYGEFPISSGPYSVTFTDLTNPSVQNTITVQPPATCSNGGNLSDLEPINLLLPASVAVGSTFAVNFSVRNNGNIASSPVSAQIRFDNSSVGIPVGTVNIGILQPGQSTALTAQVTVPPQVQPGAASIHVTVDNLAQLPEINENNNSRAASFLVTSQSGGQIDVSLTLQQLTASPAQWSNYSVKATLTNIGPLTATGVKVKFPKPNGVVYVGGNEYAASPGTFTPFGDEVWTVGNIPANGTAILTVNYFLLNATAPVAYAQVSAANETDSDSQPNNGTPPTPVQDDEASTFSGGGGSQCSINAGYSTQCDDNNTPNDPSDDTFTVGLLVTGTNIGSNGWQTYSGGVVVAGQYGIVSTFGPYPIISGNAVFDIWDAGDATCFTQVYVPAQQPCSNNGGSGQIDLSLSLQQLTANPAQWSNYPVKLTINNAGPQTATGVKVKFAKPNGVVYVGGNTHTVSQGTFNALSDEIWTVGSVPANGSATLTVNYFLLNATAPVAYAQVTAANETDSDSQPNNGTPPTPVQDDEASTASGGGGFSCPGNLLQNGGFETSNYNGWTGSGQTILPAYQPALSGSYSLKVTGVNETIYQEVPVVPGKLYTLKGRVCIQGASGQNNPVGEAGMRFKNNLNNQDFGQVTFTTAACTQSETIAMIAPAGSNVVRVYANAFFNAIIIGDDFCLTESSGGSQQPDLTISDLQIPNASVTAGAILSYNFDASNIGTGAAPGNFTIKSYISTDQTLSANDVQDGTINTGNYGTGFSVQFVPGASTIPASLAAGPYYLIVKIDADNTIAEGSENNNVVVKAFMVTGTIPPGCADECGFQKFYGPYPNLSPTFTRGSVEELSNGYRFFLREQLGISPNRLVTIETDLAGNQTGYTDVTVTPPAMEKAAAVISASNSQEIIVTKTSASNAVIWSKTISLTVPQAIAGLYVDNFVYAVGNGYVVVGSYVYLNGPNPHFVPYSIKLDLNGNKVAQFLYPEEGNVVNWYAYSYQPGIAADGSFYLLYENGQGSLFLVKIEQSGERTWKSFIASDLPSNTFGSLHQYADGSAVLVSNSNNTEAQVFKFGAQTGALLWFRNLNLTFSVPSTFSMLNDALPVSDGGAVAGYRYNSTTYGNGYVYGRLDANGNLLWSFDLDDAYALDAVHETSNCGFIFLGKKGSNLAAFKVTSEGLMTPACSGGGNGSPCDNITITPAPGQITIAGFSAPHVLIKVFRPNWTVAFECLDNCANPLTVSGLSSGTYHIQVKLIDNNWGAICYLERDVNVSSVSALRFSDDRQRLAIDKIYPNPAKNFVTLDIFSKEEQAVTLDFYDRLGQQTYTVKVALLKGNNEIELPVFDWKSGTYNIIARGSLPLAPSEGGGIGLPAYGRFLKVWEE
jgi:subtilase family serine protease